MELTAANVETVMADCMFREEEVPHPGEAPDGAVVVAGVMTNFGLHPGRLEQHRYDIVSMLSALPTEFRTAEAGGGGGWSFLNACTRADGHLWTGEHRVVEQLMVLGIGIGAVTLLLPRDMWSALPGGVPYFSVAA